MGDKYKAIKFFIDNAYKQRFEIVDRGKAISSIDLMRELRELAGECYALQRWKVGQVVLMSSLKSKAYKLEKDNEKYKIALEKIAKHGCCVMHSYRSCPGCLATNALRGEE